MKVVDFVVDRAHRHTTPVVEFPSAAISHSAPAIKHTDVDQVV